MSHPQSIIAARIAQRCSQCLYGELQSSQNVVCRYWLHPGAVGGTGTEWALRCDDFCRREPATSQEDSPAKPTSSAARKNQQSNVSRRRLRAAEAADEVCRQVRIELADKGFVSASVLPYLQRWLRLRGRSGYQKPRQLRRRR